MKLFFCLACFIFLFNCSHVFAKGDMPGHIKEKITYPVLDFHPWIGVIPVLEGVLSYNSELDYKVALDLYGTVKDSTTIHPVILEVSRTYNLIIANGVPAERLQIAAIIHGGLVQAILTEKEYHLKYQTPNPNLAALKALEDVGIKFYVCGQSMGFYDIDSERISPIVKMAISAKTSFITLDQMGFSYLNVSGD